MVTGVATRTLRAPGTVQLLEADPDLGMMLSEARRAEAERELVVRTYEVPSGPWDVTRLSGTSGDHVGLLILEGVLSRELVVADQVSAELLGPGDVIRPWQVQNRASLLPVEAVWSVLSPVTVAALDRHFAVELARYPEITSVLLDRFGERSIRLATTQAISQLTRVDRRLKALLWHLAERWGRVSGDGVIVPLALTHRILGQLVGARRPTVSTALGGPARLAGQRLGVGRIAAQQPRPVGPAHELVALGELRQGGRDRRPARADELAEDAVGQRERDDHAVAGHAPPALGQVPEQRLQAAVDAGQL